MIYLFSNAIISMYTKKWAPFSSYIYIVSFYKIPPRFTQDSKGPNP